MEPFTKNINGIDFRIHGQMERDEEICRVFVDNTSFKMIINEEGNWQIWQQVPSWIKELENKLAEAIDEAYC